MDKNLKLLTDGLAEPKPVERRNSPAISWVTLVCALFALAIVGGALYVVTRRQSVASQNVQAIEAKKWHPQPAFLLQHSAQLGLNAGQVRHMKVVMRDWELRKAAYDVSLSRFHKTADQALAELSTDNRPTGDYARMLFALEKDRQASWERAVAKLEPDQVIKLDALRTDLLSPKKQRR